MIILILIFLISCESNRIQDDPKQIVNIDELIKNNLEKISINTGTAGTILKKEGNCMPMIGGFSTCVSYPVKRTILIYESTTFNNADGWGPLYNSVHTKLISKVDSDQNGFFQITLSPGKYSIFISENNKFYANGSDGQGVINPLIIQNDSVSIIKLNLDYAVY
jgi:hypothetical protein